MERGARAEAEGLDEAGGRANGAHVLQSAHGLFIGAVPPLNCSDVLGQGIATGYGGERHDYPVLPDAHAGRIVKQSKAESALHRGEEACLWAFVLPVHFFLENFGIGISECHLCSCV